MEGVSNDFWDTMKKGVNIPVNWPANKLRMDLREARQDALAAEGDLRSTLCGQTLALADPLDELALEQPSRAVAAFANALERLGSLIRIAKIQGVQP